MKILHLTDLHYRRRWFDWALTEVRNVDVVVVSGDLIDALPTARTRLRDQVRWVSEWCHLLPCVLAICTGNHDAVPAGEGLKVGDEEGEWLVKLRQSGRVLVDGDDTILAGIRFVCRPWIGGSWPTPGTVPTVLVSHGGPAGTDVVGMELDSPGDPDVADIAASLPADSWVVSGHVHNPKWWYDHAGHAHCSNPGVAPWSAPRPNSVVIDTDQRTATSQRWDREVEVVRY
jgi:predicted phosphodiesterase